MENTITFSAKQEDGISGKCYTQKINAITKTQQADIQGRQVKKRSDCMC
jgi:hypothetical protein